MEGKELRTNENEAQPGIYARGAYGACVPELASEDTEKMKSERGLKPSLVSVSWRLQTRHW